MALGQARLTGEQRLLNSFPMINMAGLATCFFAWLLSGCTAVQHHPFKLPLFLQQLLDERMNQTVAPPAILTAWLNNEALTEGIDFTRLTRIGSGGANSSSSDVISDSGAACPSIIRSRVFFTGLPILC